MCDSGELKYSAVRYKHGQTLGSSYAIAMAVWRGRGRRGMSFAFSLVMLVACGGQSSDRRGVGGGAGGPGQPAACTYNGVVYESGQRFGRCGECSCLAGAITCAAIDCAPATGGSGGGAAVGNAGTGVGQGGSSASGASAGAAGTSGASAGSGAAGAGVAGDGGVCQLATIGSLCVLGTPASTGQDLIPGTPLVVSLQPAGCYSSSCTKLVSSSCNYLGSGGMYWISGFVCLKTEGDACTDDCGGARAVPCEPGVTLEAGEYTVGLGGSSKSVSFKVPSHVPDGGLCVSLDDP